MMTATNTFHYKLNNPRGYGLIIVNSFNKIEDCKRHGAANEKENLINLFESMGLEVIVEVDKTKNEMFTFLNKYSQNTNLKQHSMIAIAISSHGCKEGILGINIEERLAAEEKSAKLNLKDVLTIQEIREMFNGENCPNLVGKPKMIVINGCQGANYENSICTDALSCAANTIISTTWSDFFTLFSCVQGHISLRSTKYGSFYITALLETYNKYGKDLSIDEMLPIVNQSLIENTSALNITTNKPYAESCHWESTCTRILKIEPVGFHSTSDAINMSNFNMLPSEVQASSANIELINLQKSYDELSSKYSSLTRIKDTQTDHLITIKRELSKFSLIDEIKPLASGMENESQVDNIIEILNTHLKYCNNTVRYENEKLKTENAEFGKGDKFRLILNPTPQIPDSDDIYCVQPRMKKGLTFNSKSCSLTYTSAAANPALFSWSYPLTRQWNYFEIQILNAVGEGDITIGLVHCNYSFTRHVGWDNNSIGYHADNGKLYKAKGSGDDFGTPCTVGDYMGCGIYYEGSTSDGIVHVYFTKNHIKISPIINVNIYPGGMFPAVALHSEGDKIRLILNPTPQITDNDDVYCVQPRWKKGLTFNSISCSLTYTSAAANPSLFSWSYPLTRQWNYFEIQILNAFGKGAISIGLVHCDYSLTRHVGWDYNSIGYHADDGKLYKEVRKDFGTPCTVGDYMGCGIYYEGSSSDGIVHVYFTKNHVKISPSIKVNIYPGGMFPAVALHNEGDKIRLFLYPIHQIHD